MCPRIEASRPVRDLLEQLPKMPLTPDGHIDFRGADRGQVEKLGDDAETTMRCVQSGVTAIGHLLAHSAVPIESGDIGAPSLEAIGFLLGELGDLAAVALVLSGACRAALANAPRLNRAQQRR